MGGVGTGWLRAGEGAAGVGLWRAQPQSLSPRAATSRRPRVWRWGSSPPAPLLGDPPSSGRAPGPGIRAGLGAGAALTAAPGGQDRGQQQQQDERQPHAGAGQGDTGVTQLGTARPDRRQRQDEPGRAGTAGEGVARGRFRTPGPSQHKRGRTLAEARPRGTGTGERGQPGQPGTPCPGQPDPRCRCPGQHRRSQPENSPG